MGMVKNIIDYNLRNGNAKSLTECDKKLIEQAEKLHYTEWYKAGDYAEEAESDLAKKILRNIEINLHHQEEFHCGLL